mgnify:CR=1 FL=1
MRKILLTTIILTICCNVIISSRPIDRIVISCIAPEPNDSVTVFSFDNKFNVKKGNKTECVSRQCGFCQRTNHGT